MHSFRRILVVLDGPVEHAQRVLDDAAALARVHEATMVLVRPARVTTAFAPPSLYAVSRAVSLVEDSERRVLQALARRLEPGRVEDARVLLGDPSAAICSAARSVDADLIVIGSEKPAGFLRRASKTPVKVVASAPCPVIVVRERPRHAA